MHVLTDYFASWAILPFTYKDMSTTTVLFEGGMCNDII